MFVTNVAGVTFRPEALDMAERGMKVSLQAERNNPHDPDAVAVWDDLHCVQFGYIKRNYTKVVRACLERGEAIEGEIIDIVGGKDGLTKGIVIRVQRAIDGD